MQYTVIIEKAGDDCSAYVPDLPSCVAAADTPDEVLELGGALSLQRRSSAARPEPRRIDKGACGKLPSA